MNSLRGPVVSPEALAKGVPKTQKEGKKGGVPEEPGNEPFSGMRARARQRFQ